MVLQMFTRDDAHEFKPALAEIQDAPVHPLAGVTLWAIVATVVFFGVWATVGQVDVVVSAPGKVIPDGHPKVLQPLDTGVVSRLLVKEGDLVRRGQVLLEIDPAITGSELESARRSYDYTQMEMERLQATLEGRAFRPRPAGQDGQAVAAQVHLYAAARAALEGQLAAKEQELAQVEAKEKATGVERQKNESLLQVSLEKEKRLSAVKDIIARDEYEKVQSDIVTYGGNVQQAGHELQELAHRKEQLGREIEKITSDFRASNLQEPSDRQKKAIELEGKEKELVFKHTKQQIVAPVDGFVDTLFVHTVGGVVTPAEKLLSLIPSKTPLVVDVAVSNKDIGFVEPGMAAAIKVDTFDFQKYGMFEGKVRLISKYSHDDERSGQAKPADGAEKKLEQVYEVYITPVTRCLVVEGKEQPLAPGMTLTAEIKVGKRRIIELFIYPLIKYWHEGISVR